MTLMRKLTLNFGHSLPCNPVKVKVMRVGWPIGLITSGCSPSLVVMLILIHGMTPHGYAWAPPIIQQQLGASLLVGTHPDSGH